MEADDGTRDGFAMSEGRRDREEGAGRSRDEGPTALPATPEGRPPRWPPPGLERVQGDLFAIAARAALAGVILVLPLLFVATRDGGFATLGPLADAWWIILALATVGLAFALDATARTARALRRAADALVSGHDLFTVLRVLADAKRDMGFLIVGARHFSLLDARRRDGALRMRVTAALLLAAAGLWLPVTFSLGLFFASRGALSATELQTLVLAPALVAYLLGGVLYLLEERRVRAARKAWYRQPGTTDSSRDEVLAWRASMDAHGRADGGDVVGGLRVGSGALRWGGIVVGALSVAVALPVLTLVPASAVGPILSTVSAPGMETYRPRAARAEAYRSYAIEADPDVTPQEAGAILHSLTFVGSSDAPGAGEREPERRIAEPWIPRIEGSGDPLDLAPFAWGDSLLERVDRGLDPSAEAYLRSVADHPLVASFSRLARAPSVDVASGRWERPFPPGVSMATLPVPQFQSLRSAANARIAAAALAMDEGDAEEAERVLAEVVSVGFLLADDGPTLIDNLVGYAIVEAGGAALSDLFRLSMQPGESAQLSRLRQVAERSAALMETGVAEGTEAWVASLPDRVLDESLARGLRWEYFINLTTMAPCLNMNRLVFGAGEEYSAFVDQAREGLVRWPSEEPLFELARQGWAGGADGGGSGLLAGLLGLYTSRGEDACTVLLRRVGGSGFQ